ncbi:MAG: tyrosine-type recombinase/integrase, partial [Promethearchaeia archaeon]
MLDINRKEEIDLKEIYGEKRYKKWINKKYPSLNNEDVQSWIRDMIFQYCEDGKNPKNFKIPTYMSPFQQFCNYNKVDNPSELLEEDIDQRNLRLRKYLTFLQNAPKKEIQERTEGFKRGRPARTTIRNMIQSRVKSFYSNRGRNISFGLKKAKSGKNKNEIHLTKSLVRKIQARIRVPNYKVISAFQSQLGLRIGDVLGTLIKKGYNIRKYKDHYYINSFKTQKNGITINFLFFTEDLTNTLLSVYGSKCNNDLTKLNLSSILRTREKNIIDRANYLNDLKRVIEELGIEENIKTHSFRKFFSSQVRKCKKVDDEFKEHLMGHSSYNLSQAYNNNLR